MSAVWILIILLILLILTGVGLAIWYFVYYRNKGSSGPSGPPPPPPPPPSGPTGTSIIFNSVPPLGLTKGPTGSAIVYNPLNPLPPTGSNNSNSCSRYSWIYTGGTGTIGLAPTGPTGTAVIKSGTGSTLQYSLEGGFLQVNNLVSGSNVIVGSTGSPWIFVPNTNNSFGKWCLTNVIDKLLCLHYNPFNAASIDVKIKEFRLFNTTDANDRGFDFSYNNAITPPLCVSGN